MAKKKLAPPFTIGPAKNVPLAHCTIWVGNVNYSAAPDQVVDAMLTASVKAYGVLQPVIGFKNGEDGSVLIVAGRRRFNAAYAAKLKEIPVRFVEASQKVLDDADELERLLTEISLAENVARVQMGPFAEADAFARAALLGSVRQVAKTFGVPETYVRQRMQLVNVIEDARRAFLDPEQDIPTLPVLQRMSAFPKERQQEWWDKYFDSGMKWVFGNVGQFNSNLVRPDFIDVESANFDTKQVPEDAWEPRDLFMPEDAPRRIRSDVFNALQRGAIQAQMVELEKEGWSHDRIEFVDRNTSGLPSDFWENRVQPEMVKSDRLVEIQNRMAEIDDVDPDTTDPEQEEALTAEYQKLEEEESELLMNCDVTVPTEIIERGRVMLVLEENGRVEKYFFDDPEARSAARRAADAANGVAPQDAEPEDAVARYHETSGQSEILADAMNLAICRKVMEDPRAGLAIMVVRLTMAQYALGGGRIREFGGDDFLVTIRKRTERKDYREQFDNIDEIIEWLETGEFGGTPEQVFDFCIKLDLSDLVNLVAVLSVRSLRARPDMDRSLMTVMELDVRREFTPHALYLGGYTKADLFAILAEHNWTEGHAVSDKKPDLIEACRSMFQSDDDRIGAWLPPSMEHLRSEPVEEEAVDETTAEVIQITDERDGAEA